MLPIRGTDTLTGKAGVSTDAGELSVFIPSVNI